MLRKLGWLLFPHPCMWIGSLQFGCVLLSPQPVHASFLVPRVGDNPEVLLSFSSAVHESEVTTTLWHRAVSIQSRPATCCHHPSHASGKSYEGERGSGIYPVLVRQIWCKLNSAGMLNQTFERIELIVPNLPSRSGYRITVFQFRARGRLFPNRLVSKGTYEKDGPVHFSQQKGSGYVRLSFKG